MTAYLTASAGLNVSRLTWLCREVFEDSGFCGQSAVFLVHVVVVTGEHGARLVRGGDVDCLVHNQGEPLGTVWPVSPLAEVNLVTDRDRVGMVVPRDRVRVGVVVHGDLRYVRTDRPFDASDHIGRHWLANWTITTNSADLTH